MLRISGCQILTAIYESAHSLIYRGIREQDNQPVILKMLKDDYPTPQELTRYKQEYEIINHLNYEGVVKAYSLEEYQRRLVIIFEDFGGNSLKMLMNNAVAPGIASLKEFLNLAIQTSEILGKIHEANVIHKDINPANIVLHPETKQIKIIDFGISTVFSRENPTLTKAPVKNPNVLEGTLAYISPEQTGRMNRDLDYRTDFYSLGVTFYELLTGKLPFETTDALELVHCHIAKQPISPHEFNLGIPKAVANIVMKLMAKTAEDRYQSAWGIKADLEHCLQQLQHHQEILEFSLGNQDISDKFQIPQKLYGREAEVETLLAAFERIVAGGAREEETTNSHQKSASEMMLVAGYSGIGKSALVQEIYKPITRSRGYFISGKFDQFQRNIPYSAIVNAFKGLIRQLLTETEVQLAQWREKLLTALGVNGQVIINVIPEVELIVGKQPAIPELGATEAQNRFHLVFQNFIQAFCAPEHPLVIFLDDLQWADFATLNLLELMMIDTETKYLFLIGAYRDNEVSQTHPLMISLEALGKAGVIINKITLTPLQLPQVSQLVAETLHSDIEAVKPLAELVRSKTDGNPFFVNEFLKYLYQKSLLKFNSQSQCWQWSINEIEAIKITDNVIDLMICKIQNLPILTQQALRLAACIGVDFDLNVLSVICEQPSEKVFFNLKSAIQLGFIVIKSELDNQLLIKSYQFSHDRIQQAAYELIDDSQKKAVHLRIGNLLVQNTEPQALSGKIFEIVEHFNFSVDLVKPQEQRDELARLNLFAGQKAKASMAYKAAVKYFNTGLDLLTAESWQSHYKLTLSLYEEAVEAEYLNSNYERAEMLSEVVLQQAKTVLDKFRVYENKIQFSAVQNKMQTAINTGLQVLEMLGVSLSESPPQNLVIENLYNQPEMTDATALSAMRILMNLFSPVYISNPSLLPPIAFTMLKLCIQKGNSPQAAFAYAFYGVLLCTSMEDIELGYQFGKLALRVLDKFESRDIKCKVHEVFNAFIRHWKEPARASIEPLRDTVQFGLETGDIEFAGYAAIHYCAYILLIGDQLEDVNKKQLIYIELNQKFKQNFSLYYAKVWRQLTLNLMGKTNNEKLLIGESFDEAEMLPFLQSNNNLSSLFCVHLAKSILSYLFKDYTEAVSNAAIATNYEQSMAALLPAAQHPFYYSLALLAVYPTAENNQKIEYIEKVNINQNKLKHWANFGAINFKHKYDLVEAEKARVLGQNWQAAELYEQAIQGAKDNGYIQEEALAYELATEFYLARGMDKIAQTYLKEAHYSYTIWQAWAKVQDLESRYPQLLTKSSVAPQTTDKSTTSTTTSTSSKEALDLATVIKASQAIGSEIVIEQLLQKLMKILVENAGAQSGFLLLEKNKILLIEAESSVEFDNVTVLESISPKNRLPISLLNYVVRTSEIIVLNDATTEGNFTNDPYIRKHKPKSILCVPLINQGKLISLIYLENNLTTGAFTPDRLEVLKILSSQAAISIENARLYQTLEDKVTERTAQLAQANQEITTLNTKLKQENLRMSAELEVTKQLQQMVLPKQSELDAVEGLEIAAFMEPADEIGGDYYDVLQHNGKVKIGIGDVTGHGLESGVLMLMVQTAVRTLQESNQTDPVQFLDILNRTIYGNAQRINPYKNLTLALLDYADNTLTLSGQHESIIIVRSGGIIEQIDTINLGFPIGLENDIADLINTEKVQLNSGDIVVLYTDGITEAFDINRQEYGQERLCEIVSNNWQESAEKIKQAVIEDVRRHIGKQKVFDDITLVVMKQK